jgi:hypothetical protein
MSWVKRNLFFVVGALVALALMGWAGFFLYTKWTLNNATQEELNKAYSELDSISKLEPSPGSAKVDNIKAAREQQEQLRAYMKNAAKHFGRIPGIPDSAKVTGAEFTAALRHTISQLQRDATNAGVVLQPKYSFSFEAQLPKVVFAPGSLDPLAVQLGEVKAICDVLFQAKINSLDNLRRERVSEDDNQGPQSDYHDRKSVTNELAILTPYEVTFQCFSAELAGVLSGFANAPYGFVVRTINVEPAAPAAPTDTTTPVVFPTLTPNYVPNYPPPLPRPRLGRSDEDSAFQQRYGIRPRPVAPAPQPIYVPQPIASPTSRGLPTVLDEKQIKVTAAILIVKLLPQKN